MLPYFLLLFGSALIPLFVYRPVKGHFLCGTREIITKRNILTTLLFFSGLFLLLTLRDISVGKDLLEYKVIFEICSRSSFVDLFDLNWEIGYTIYNKLISLVFNNYRFFLIVTAFVTIFPIYIFYAKEKRYSYLLIVLFLNMPCFLMLFSGLRQAIATSIGLLAYMFIEKNKHIRGVLLILLAVTFHVSAVVLLLIYPAKYLKIKTKHLAFIAPALLVIYIFRVQIFTLILYILPPKYIEFYGEIQQTGALGMLVLFLIFSVFSFVILDENIMSPKDYFLRNILLISTIFQFFVPIHGLIQRASYYFLIFIPISILGIVQAPKRKLKNISNIAIVVMGCFFTVYFFLNAVYTTDNLLDVFPYKFFWSDTLW